MFKNILLVFISILVGASAQGQICGEMFRSTVAQTEVINRPFVGYFGNNASMKSPGASESRILRAVLSDILGVDGVSARARHTLNRAFALPNLDRSRHNDLLVEYHRRRYIDSIRTFSVPSYKDIMSRLRENKPYLSLAFSTAANGAVNMLSYYFLSTFGFLVHIPEIRIFNPRNIPDEVLNELIGTPTNAETPKTRNFVATKIRHGVDTVFAAGRRAFNIGALAVILVASANFAADPKTTSDLIVETTTSNLHRAAIEQNRETLLAIQEKRREFLIAGDTERVAAADRLILELEQAQTSEPSMRSSR